MLNRFERQTIEADPDEPVQRVACRMRDEHVGLVVVTRDHRPVGVVTDRDLATRVVAGGLDATRTPVREIMSPDPVSIPRDASLDTALALLRRSGVRRLPIVDDHGHLTGVVSADDLTILLAHELGEIASGIEQNVEGADLR
jgi:CBS domain-containing protein